MIPGERENGLAMLLEAREIAVHLRRMVLIMRGHRLLRIESLRPLSLRLH